MFQPKARSLIPYKKSNRSTIYCWQIITLHPSGAKASTCTQPCSGNNLGHSMLLQGSASKLCPDCWGRSSGCVLFMLPFKTNPTKEQSPPSAGNVSGPDIWRCPVLSAEEWASRSGEGAACSRLLGASSFHSELNSNCETGKEGRRRREAGRENTIGFVTKEICPSRSLHMWSKPILWEKREIMWGGG